MSAQLQEDLEALAHEASFLNDYASDSFDDTGHNEVSQRWCLFPRNETEPLLPVAPPPTLYRALIEWVAWFIWNYVLPERLRRFYKENTRLVVTVGFLVLVVIGVVLILTGNFTTAEKYLRPVYCFIWNQVNPDSPYAKICH